MSLNLDRSDWKRVKLGDVVLRSRIQVDPVDGGVDRYVAGGHVDTESVIIQRYGDVADGQMGSTFRYLFKPGQVLFVSARPYLRKAGVPDFAGVVADKTYVLDVAPGNGLLHDMLPFLLTSDHFVEYATQEATGSMNPRLLWGAMQRYEFHLPPLDDQKRIADLLWAVENHRRSVEPVSLRCLEGLLLESLLEIEAPKVPVSSLGSVLMGRQRSPQNADGDHMVPYLRVANIGDNQLRLDDIKRMNFTPDEQRRYSVESADILVSEGQSRELVGQSVLIDELPKPMCFQNTLIRFRADRARVRPAYAQMLFRACLRAGTFSDIATQTTLIAHLGVQRFSALKLPLPTLGGQDLLLTRISTVSRALEAAATELASLTAFRASLIAEIFGDN